MSIPSKREIDPYGDLDGASARRTFEGKSVAEAERLIAESSLARQEDLFWMGPVAFVYYLPAAAAYLEGESAAGDSDFVSSLCGTLVTRCEQDGAAIDEARPTMRRIADYVRENVGKFDLDADETSSVLRKITALLDRLD